MQQKEETARTRLEEQHISFPDTALSLEENLLVIRAAEAEPLEATLRVALVADVLESWSRSSDETRREIYLNFKEAVALVQERPPIDINKQFKSKLMLSFHKKIVDIRQKMRLQSDGGANSGGHGDLLEENWEDFLLAT